jgi:hypothetical protein
MFPKPLEENEGRKGKCQEIRFVKVVTLILARSKKLSNLPTDWLND